MLSVDITEGSDGVNCEAPSDVLVFCRLIKIDLAELQRERA
jgi:hypothetical protein